MLSNGNFVVTDPEFDLGGEADVGAAYLYNGVSSVMISMLTGTTARDRIGLGGVTVLNTGSYLLHSPAWSNGSAAEAGRLPGGLRTAKSAGKFLQPTAWWAARQATRWVSCSH